MRLLVVAVGLSLTTLTVNGQAPARSMTSPVSTRAIAPRSIAPSSARIAGTPRTTIGGVRVIDPRGLPGTPERAFSTIKGNALDSKGSPLPNTTVRLRDARSGQIVQAQVTDNSGIFAFRGIDPGSYVVEIMGNDQTILAASQLLNINAGDALSAVVKLPFRIPPFAGFLGHTASSATVVAGAAASAEVLAAAATQATSPE